MNFSTWLNEKEDLRRLNEAFDEKDHKRIEDMVTKANGDTDKLKSLATTMANTIKDAEKALRRAEAAKEAGLKDVSKIFKDRAEELGASVPEEAEEAEEPAKDEKPAKAPRVKKEKPAPVEKLKVGDYVKVSAQMVLDGRIALADTGGWRYIKASGQGNRQVNVEAPRKATRGSYSYRHGGYRGGSPGSEASASIDKTYLTSLGDEAIFYVKIKLLGSMWIEGTVHFTNGLDDVNYKVRFEKKYMVSPGPELEIFLKPENQDLLAKNKGKLKFFLGDEDFVTDHDGNTVEFLPGVYRLVALCYKATIKQGTPVVYCVPSNEYGMKSTAVFCSSLAKASELGDTITTEQMTVLAEYMSKEIGADVSVRHGDTFQIPWFSITGSKVKPYPGYYRESPFFTMHDAEERIKELQALSKTKKLPYSTENLSVDSCSSYDRYQLNLTQIMDYAKLLGIEVKVRKFFEKKRGSIKGQEFGF
jgi:hypothetical protein